MLNEIEIAVLISICHKTKMSKKVHIPKQYFLNRFKGRKRVYAEKALLSLIKKGYVIKHPTRGEMTYQLTDFGRKECMKFAGS
ncbi:hypothetical protein DRN80_06405 [Methanosarcinales archaeon]|nr:hypothetical protein [Methanophagales archaeon]RLG32267.1 MAG: hypothetical protein DRN80_06405 [Methanosarcinales archaeon]